MYLLEIIGGGGRSATKSYGNLSASATGGGGATDREK
jgi:hypothetical protein